MLFIYISVFVCATIGVTLYMRYIVVEKKRQHEITNITKILKNFPD